MKIFGFDLTLTRQKALNALSPYGGGGGWWPVIREPFTNAWQRNIDVKIDNVLTHSAVFACVTLIASDIAKLRLRLVQQDVNGIWTETESAAFSPVLRKPNRYQNRIQFITSWLTSKLIHGNSYILKQRDQRGLVTAMYVLNPQRVTPLVSDDGAVYYDLWRDNLSGLETDRLLVPAREIIHDVMVQLHHPLCGVSPIYACGLAATHGLNIQHTSTYFFEHGAKPAGILTAPGTISDEKANQLAARWRENFSGPNSGRTAILGDGLHYEPLTMSAVDTDLINQLKWTAETVCSAYHVPPYMIGVGPYPSYNNIEALNQQYYAQCLQRLMEELELLLDEGLELPKPYGTEFDRNDLLLMDTPTRVKAAADAIGSGGMAPNEARKLYFDLGPVEGGDSPMIQQQQFSLAALAERDRDKPFAKPANSAPATPATTPEPDTEADDADVDDDNERALTTEDIYADLNRRAAKFGVVREAA